MTDQAEVQRHFEQRAIDAIRQHVIGFVATSDDPHRDAPFSMGSGTLVDVEGVRGILTAAHVWHAMSTRRRVGIIRFGKRDSLESLIFAPADSEAVVLGGEALGDAGPDLAFIAPSPSVIDSLAATGVFYSPLARALAVERRPERTIPRVQARCAVGVLGQATEQLLPRGEVVRTSFSTLVLAGEIEDRSPLADGFHTFTFRPRFEAGFSPKLNYGGMSGGSIWQFFDEAPPLDRDIIGVSFRQSAPDESGERLLICNGPMSILRKLAPAVLDRFGKDGNAWR